MKKVKLLVVASAIAMAAMTGVAQAKTPVVLVFHPGAFIFNPAQEMPEARQVARQDGFRPIYVNYPLANVPEAVTYSMRLARRLDHHRRDVYAYGESAGGMLATWLAEKGVVASCVRSSAGGRFTGADPYAQHTFP